MKSEVDLKNSRSNNFENKLNEISSLLNYNFKNKMHLVEALTRQSAVIERHPNASPNNYQRLEFLGDSILNLCISDFIFELFPDKKEEDLHPLRSFIIKNETLAGLAEKLKLGSYIIVGKGEESQNIRNNRKVLADIIEAIIGAVFIDSGRNYLLTKNILIHFFKPLFFQDKNFKRYERELNAYFEKMSIVDHNDVSYVLDQINCEDISVLSEKNSSFCDLIDIKSIPIIQNTNSNLIPSEFPDIMPNNINPVSFMSNSFINVKGVNSVNGVNDQKCICNCTCFSMIENQISQFINKDNNLYLKSFFLEISISDIADIFLSSEKYEVEEKLDNLFKNKIKVDSNYFLDFELLYVNSNENFSVLLANNSQNVVQVISFLINKIKISYEKLEVKQHFFASKLLMNIIINIGNNIPDFYIKSIICLIHNGISEFRRKNYIMSKNFLEQGFETIGLLEMENDCNLNRDFYDCKYLCIIYLSEIEFLNQNIEGHNKYFQIAKSQPQSDSCEIRYIQIQKIFLKNLIINNCYCFEKISELFEDFANKFNNLSESAKSSKIFQEEYINMKINKFKFNKNLKDFTELHMLERSVIDLYGKDCHLLYPIFEFFGEKLEEEIIYSSNINKNFQILEKLCLYSYKNLKIVIQNFTVNSAIFLENLKFYNKSLENYSNFNNS